MAFQVLLEGSEISQGINFTFMLCRRGSSLHDACLNMHQCYYKRTFSNAGNFANGKTEAKRKCIFLRVKANKMSSLPQALFQLLSIHSYFRTISIIFTIEQLFLYEINEPNDFG